MAARVWLPEDADADPVPVIVEYHPYRKRDLSAINNQPMHAYLAGHGYAAVRLEIRGSGESDGILRDEYLAQELQDACDAIAWLASQPWCVRTGRDDRQLLVAASTRSRSRRFARRRSARSSPRAPPTTATPTTCTTWAAAC